MYTQLGNEKQTRGCAGLRGEGLSSIQYTEKHLECVDMLDTASERDVGGHTKGGRGRRTH